MVFWVVMVVAVVNIGLGFTAAVCLARRYQRRVVQAIGSSFEAFGPSDFSETDAAVAAEPNAETTDAEPRPDASASDNSASGNSAPGDSHPDDSAPAGTSEAAVAESPSKSDAGATLPQSEESQSRTPEPEAPNPQKPEPRASASELPEPEASASEPTKAETPEPEGQTPGEDPLHAGRPVIEDLARQIEEHDGRLIELDGLLRSGAASSDAASVLSYVESLRQTAQDYLGSQSAVFNRFREKYEDRGELRGACDNVRAAVEAQEAQILATVEAMKNVANREDAAEVRKEVLGHTARLLAASDRLRDRVEEATIELARREETTAASDPPPPEDQPTGILSRRALEAKLASIRRDDPTQDRPVSLALLDVDELGRINERYGHEAGNRILLAMASILTSEGRGRFSPARFSGQRFAVLIPDADVRSAGSLVERLRQTIEKCRFQYDEFTLQVTVSCGVTVATADDSSESLFARAENALQEAKRYGRNRSFLHEGRYPSPVVPSSLALEERVVTL